VTRSTERTYSGSGFGIEELLDEWYAVRGCLSAARTCAGENVVVFERERDRLLLDEGGARETEIGQGAEDERREEMGKLCKFNGLVDHPVLSLLAALSAREFLGKIIMHVIQLSDHCRVIRILVTPRTSFAGVRRRR